MQTIMVERCAIVKNIPLFYFDWRIKRLNYFVVFCWNCEEFYKFRFALFWLWCEKYGRVVIFERERNCFWIRKIEKHCDGNERKPSTLPIRVVHQRMAQTTEDRAAINDRWRQLSRRIVQQREHEFHSIIEQNAYTIRTRCTRNPLKGFAPFLGLNPSMTLPRKPTVSAFQPLPESPCFPSFFENNKFQEREAG